MISRFCEQFSRNGSAMAPERLFEKISDFKNMNLLYTILKHVVWRFQIYNYFLEIFKFRENMSKTDFAKFLKAFIKSRNLNISRKKLYIRNLQTTCFKLIYSMFIVLKSEIFSNSPSGAIAESFRENCS